VATTAHDQDDAARLCSGCVGESFLKAEMQSQGTSAACSFCGKKGKTYSIEEVADRVEAALEEHYTQTPSEPSGYQYALIKEGEYDWEREGDPILQVIQSMADIDEEPAREILSALQLRDDYTEGEEGKFDDEAHYVDAAASDWELHSHWREFEKSVKTEARFFSPAAQEILARVFKDVAVEKTLDGNAVVIEAGPGKPISVLFRARTFQSDSMLEEALCRPDLKVGSPPPAVATAARMNAHGISLFYGATDPNVAVAEVRPPVGSRVVVGRFFVIRSARLLDVEALRSVLVEGSEFDPLFIRRRERAKFLERLSHRITMPVMPDDEAVEYLVTQVIADYLASTGLDGVVFPSVQVPDGKNVVLFHKAARVEELEIPKDADVSATLSEMTEDGPEVDYYVMEKLPPPPTENKDAGDGAVGVDVLRVPPLPLVEQDPRETTLRLDVDKLEVRYIEAVSFKTKDYPVRRHRYTESDKY
jgi:RES domain-containing protein/HEPN superfamily RES-like protein